MIPVSWDHLHHFSYIISCQTAICKQKLKVDTILLQNVFHETKSVQ